MKNTIKMMLVSAALAVPSMAAAAECTFVSDKNLPAQDVASYIAQYKPTTVGEFINVFNAKIIPPAQQLQVFANVPKECRGDLLRGLLELNKIKVSDSVTVLAGRPLFLPTIGTLSAPAIKPEPIAVTKEEAPVAQAAVKPLVEPSADVRKVQADLQTAKQEQSRLKAEVAAIAARSTNTNTQSTNTKLSPEDRAKVDQLLKVNGEVKSLETRLRAYVDEQVGKVNGRINAIVGKDGKTGMLGDVVKVNNEQNKRLGELEARTVAGLPEWLFWVLGALGLGLLGLLILRAVDHTALRSILGKHTRDIENVNIQLDAIGDALPADIKLMIHWHDMLKALHIGEVTDINVCEKDENGYGARFVISVEKISDDEVKCYAGIKGHQVDNAIKIANLEKTARKAGYKNLLNKPIGQLRSVAA